MFMGYEVKKTEHAGPKRGNGAYWGPKKIAKAESSKIRRRNWKHEIAVEHLERHIAEGLQDLKAGRSSGPFDTADEAVASLHRAARAHRTKDKK